MYENGVRERTGARVSSIYLFILEYLGSLSHYKSDKYDQTYEYKYNLYDSIVRTSKVFFAM